MLNMRKKARALTEVSFTDVRDALIATLVRTDRLLFLHSFFEYLKANNMYNENSKSTYEAMTIEDLLKDYTYYQWFVGFYLPEEYEETKDTLYNALQPLLVNGQITVYRAMKVREDYIQNLSVVGGHLGIYWAYDKDHALTYSTKQDKAILINNFNKKGFLYIILEAFIKEQYIDWVNTLVANNVYKHEHEITLFKNAPIQITAIYYMGNANMKLDITPIKGMTFYA